MVKINQDRIIGVFAPSGYGKSVLVASLIDKIAEKGRVIWYDTDLEQYKYSFNNNVKFFKPDIQRKDELRYLNEFIAGLRAETTDIYLVVDDLDKFFDANTSLSKASVELKNLSSASRHQRIAFIYCSKQPRYIPAKLISNTNLFYIGQFSEYGDLQKFKPMLNKRDILYEGKNTDSFAVIKVLKKDRHEFIEYDRWTNTIKVI